MFSDLRLGVCVRLTRFLSVSERVLTQHLHAKRFGPWDRPESWGTAGSWGGGIIAWGGSVGLQAWR